MTTGSTFSCQMAIIPAKQRRLFCSFLRNLGSVDAESIRFHFGRADFQKWIRTTIGDEELAQRIDKLYKNLSIESLQKHFAAILQKRISELQLTDT
jgi:hypothetical protein